MDDKEKLIEALRLLQKATLQIDRLMQTWCEGEYDALLKLGIRLPEENE